MAVERKPQLCFLNMNIEVHFAHPLWYILLRKPLDSSITHQWAPWYPLQCNSARTGAPQFPLALLTLDWPCSILFRTWFPCFPHSSIPTGAPRSGMSLLYWIPHSIPPHPWHPPPFRHSSANMGTSQSPSALLSLDLALFFILRSFNTLCILLFSTQHSLAGPPLVNGGCSPFSSE